LDGRLRLRQAALRRTGADVRPPALRADHPRAGRHAAAVSDDEDAASRQHLLGRDHPVAGQRLRHLPHPPVHALHPAGAARGRAHRRRGRAADLLVGGHAARTSHPRHARHLHLHDDVERFHVAADHPQQRRALHAARGHRQPLRRARRRRRADDGGIGGDRAAGAAAVPVFAALLHRRVDGGKRQGMIGLALAAILWTAHPADGVEMKLTREADVNRIDFDFHGHGGYAIARRAVDLDLPPNYRFVFRIRGDAPPENLEFKLINGDNVWWLNRRDFHFPPDFTTLKTKKRQIAFAWGPAGGGEIRHVDSMEVVVTAGSGGKGAVWFSDPELQIPPADLVELSGLIIEPSGERTSRPLRADETSAPLIFLDGVKVEHPLIVGKFVWLPDAEARTVRAEGSTKVTIEPPEWAPTINDFYSIVARDAKRGDYPRYLIGEQPYWTVIGADG